MAPQALRTDCTGSRAHARTPGCLHWRIYGLRERRGKKDWNDAFYSSDIEITPEIVGRVSPYHTESGVRGAALIGAEWGMSRRNSRRSISMSWRFSRRRVRVWM
jgi:hypothetical protein